MMQPCSDLNQHTSRDDSRRSTIRAFRLILVVFALFAMALLPSLAAATVSKSKKGAQTATSGKSKNVPQALRGHSKGLSTKGLSKGHDPGGLAASILASSHRWDSKINGDSMFGASASVGDTNPAGNARRAGLMRLLARLNGAPIPHAVPLERIQVGKRGRGYHRGRDSLRGRDALRRRDSLRGRDRERGRRGSRDTELALHPTLPEHPTHPEHPVHPTHPGQPSHPEQPVVPSNPMPEPSGALLFGAGLLAAASWPRPGARD